MSRAANAFHPRSRPAPSPLVAGMLAISFAFHAAGARAEEPSAPDASVMPDEAPPLTVTVRPSSARPGELFLVELGNSKGLNPEVTFLGRPLPLYEAGADRLAGLGSIPVDAKPGPMPLEITLGAGPTRARREQPFTILERTFKQDTLTVARQFTHPSPAQRARMRGDNAAFVAAYRVPFGPPLFTANFKSPRPGAAINAGFGEARVFNGKQQSTHLGIDLDGDGGEPVLAANDGLVRMVRDCFGSGKTVVLSHGAGLFTGYFHLSQFAVKVGQRVQRGDTLGLLGETGRVTGPHLHLSAKLNGASFDPESLFAFPFFDEPPPVAASP